MSTFPPRRVVTGLDAEGRSTVISDGPPRHGFDSGTGYRNVDVWYLPAWPTAPTDGGERPDGPYDMEPAPGAISWQVHVIPPETAPLSTDVTVGGIPATSASTPRGRVATGPRRSTCSTCSTGRR